MFASMTIKEAENSFLENLSPLYGDIEAAALFRLIRRTLEERQGAVCQETFTVEQLVLLQEYYQRLQQQEPIQYILEEAWFYAYPFYVDKNVLIPRPETEELVHWVVKDTRFAPVTILDIGTGSGCIPITLKKELPQATVTSIDISAPAIAVARKNAAALQTIVSFLEADFLDRSQWLRLPATDIIISNPPYIPVPEKNIMPQNVTMHEPATALFVPEDNPQLFYAAIADFGLERLKMGGSIYLELHEDYATDTAKLYEQKGYTVILKKDMQEKNRMLKAWK